MINFDKEEVKSNITVENIFEILNDFGADPQYTSFGIIAATICHNSPGEGSKKLYYYTNSSLFQCYTSCGYFDIFELIIKVQSIQFGIDFDLNDAIRWIANRLGINGEYVDDEEDSLNDWKFINQYERVEKKEQQTIPVLKEYNDNVINNFNYNVSIGPWLNEGISKEAMKKLG